MKQGRKASLLSKQDCERMRLNTGYLVSGELRNTFVIPINGYAAVGLSAIPQFGRKAC